VTGATPVPETAIVAGEFVALLVTVMPPATLPAVAGANVALKVAVCPGERMTPESPPALKPAPATLTFEIVRLEFPALVSITFCEALLDTFTLPNATFVELLFKTRVTGLTVSRAALLAAVPALLLTDAVNWTPLYELVVAETVYVGDVAPPIAVPFSYH
jgi:hypothetical protein